MSTTRSSLAHVLTVCGRAAVTATLCALLIEQPLLAEAAVSKSVPAKKAEIQGQERVLHALNRFTFGPRPGDVAAVQAMGLNKWFDMQLNPGSIDDSALATRLAQYPTIFMSLAVVEEKFPSPLILRQIAEGRIPLPTDPTLHAMVKDQLAFYAIAQEQAGKISAGQASMAINGEATSKKERKKGPPPAAPAGDDNGMGMAAAPAKSPDDPDANMSKKDRKRQYKQSGAVIARNDSAMNAPAMDGPAGAGGGMQAGGMEQAPVGPNKAGLPGDLTTDPVTAALASRPGFKPYSSTEMDRILSQPPDERMKSILAMEPMELVRFRASMDRQDTVRWTAGMAPEQREVIAALGGSLRMVAAESMAARMERDIYSQRQLEAVMTDFWLNHFNVYAGKNQYEPYMLASYERDTIRPHALGKFEDLLVATAKSPAMLEYLDNFRSTGPDSPGVARLKKYKTMVPNNAVVQAMPVGLNENYGREVMELHTLGVNGAGYTQADVTNMAKVFTGWTLDKPYTGSSYMFDERRHEPGSKTVLGKVIEENGEKEGLEVLHMLATNPSTAHFISTKLAVRFVSDDPPAALVDRMTAAFLKSDGDIKVVLRTMYQSPEFWSPDVYRAKVKTPLEFVVSAARASGLQIFSPAALVQSVAKLGMPLYGMQTPNGYSWKKDDWVSTGALVSRMNFSLVMSDNRMPGTKTNWTRLLGDQATGEATFKPAAYSPTENLTGADQAAKERRLEWLLLGQPVSDRTRSTVLSQSTDSNITAQAETQFDLSASGGKGKRKLGSGAAKQLEKDGDAIHPSDDPQAAVMAGLLLGSPEFQRR